jgi:hypothetical protein
MRFKINNRNCYRICLPRKQDRLVIAESFAGLLGKTGSCASLFWGGVPRIVTLATLCIDGVLLAYVKLLTTVSRIAPVDRRIFTGLLSNQAFLLINGHVVNSSGVVLHFEPFGYRRMRSGSKASGIANLD